MWLTYACDGGTDRTTTNIPAEDNGTGVGKLGKCPEEKGPMKQEDIPGIVGWANLECPGGCLTIYKVLFACPVGETDEDQLKVIQELCQGKESCFLRPGENVFEKIFCTNKAHYPTGRLWLWFSCDGGKPNQTITFLPRDPKCERSYTCFKESACKDQAGICR